MYMEITFHNRDQNLHATGFHSLKSSPILGDKNEVLLIMHLESLFLNTWAEEQVVLRLLHSCAQIFAQLLSI